MPRSMTWKPEARMPSISAPASEGECGRMSRLTSIVSARMPVRLSLDMYCPVAQPTFQAASSLSLSG
ncbi:MAG: hypothetical protein NTW19_05710 [Planctomycetota bacterium]|nr:hypothetical protein [Planctomycetota bacterium]